LPSMTTWGELGKSNKWTSSRLVKHTLLCHNHMPWLLFNPKWPHKHCYNATSSTIWNSLRLWWSVFVLFK
jgi:hypothetical protein